MDESAHVAAEVASVSTVTTSQGDPAAARLLARGYSEAAAVVGHAASGASLAGLLLAPEWQGDAGTAAVHLLTALRSDAGVVRRELDGLAEAMTGLADDLDHARWLEGVLRAAQTAADALLVADVVQLGLDPVSDAATVAAGAGVAGLTVALREAVSGLVARLSARMASRAARLAAVRGLARFAAPRLVAGAAVSAGLQQLVAGRVSAGSAAHDAAMGVIVPPGVGRGLRGFGHTLDPRVRTLGRPLGLRDTEHWQQLVGLTRRRLAEAGYHDVQLVVRGSSVTGVKFTTGAAFDSAKRSDIDLAVVSETMFHRAKQARVYLQTPSRTVPLKVADLNRIGLDGLHHQLLATAGRKTSLMIYRDMPSVVKRGPHLLVQP